MKEIIQKAIEGGYKLDGEIWLKEFEEKGFQPEQWMYLSNPIFWQCLGKALGWNMKYANETLWRPSEHLPESCQIAILNRDTPVSYWLRFISWINDGGDPEDFFKSILPTNITK